MDELVEVSFRLLLKGLYLALRATVWVIVELGYERLAWWSGWCVCRLVTLNHYPRQRITGFDQAPGLSAFGVSFVGLLALLALAGLLAVVLGV
ncbi:hypothetical protein [Geopseudomonas aromaticivorans]